MVRVALTLLLITCTALAGAAQSTTGRITGFVIDQSRAAIPRAAVTVTSVATGVSRTVVADETGMYDALDLPPGACTP